MIAIALALASLLQETVDNPEYKGWIGFKPGSSVTYTSSRNGTPTEGSQKTTLKSITDTEAVLEMEIVRNGATLGKPFERKVPAKAPAERAGKVLRSGEEEIEVGGKKLTCTWKEMEKTLPSGKTGTSKVWISEEIPGRAARIEMTGDTGKAVMSASEWEKK
jgi:hypothetical protein